MNKKHLLLALIGALVVMIIGSIVYFALQKEKPQAAVSGVTLALSPTSGTKIVGTVFPVTINLNTNLQPTVGTDAVITYNPNDLEVQDADTATTGIQPVTAGTLYGTSATNYVSKLIDVDANTKKIFFSGLITSGGAAYTGSGVFGTINFKPLKAVVSTAVNFQFTLDATNDSNVTSSTTLTDMLYSVTNASFALSHPSVNINYTENLQGRTNHSSSNVTFEIYNLNQTTSPVFSVNNATANSTGAGSVTVNNVASANYDYRLKVKYFLGSKKTNIALTNGMTVAHGALKAGDLDDNNIINSLDFSKLNTSWTSSDAISDINQDGVVNTIDFAFLNANWGVQGQ